MEAALVSASIAVPTALSALRRLPPAVCLPSPALHVPPVLQGIRKHRRRCPLFPAAASSAAGSAAADPDDEDWLKKLPDKKKPLYSHSLPCIEAWLRKLGFRQSGNDRAVWLVEKPEWHAKLSLGVTDLHIRYLKGGSADLDKDVERRFSYALSREDIENAILGGP